MRYHHCAEVRTMPVATLKQSNNRVGRILLTITLLFLGTAAASSQTQSVAPPKATVVSGYVADTTGASIPKATIRLEAKERSILSVIADQAGHFAIEARPGEYTLTVVSLGFATYQQSINLADETSIEKDIVLKIANGGCGVCVTQADPPIELVDVSLTSTLPLNPLPPFKLHKHIAAKIKAACLQPPPSPSTAPTSTPATASASPSPAEPTP
jgi:hypothetical protein